MQNYEYTQSCCNPITQRTIWFQTMTDSELHKLMVPEWPNATRKQMLAWLHNRYRCGYMFEYLDETKEFGGNLPDFKVKNIDGVESCH